MEDADIIWYVFSGMGVGFLVGFLMGMIICGW